MKILPKFLKDTNELYSESRELLKSLDDYIFSDRKNEVTDPLDLNLKLLHKKYQNLADSVTTSYPQLLKGFSSKYGEAQTAISAHLLTTPLLYLFDIVNDFQNSISQYKVIYQRNRIDSYRHGRLKKGLSSLIDVISWSHQLIALILFKLRTNSDQKTLFEKSIDDFRKKVQIARQL